MCGRYYRRSDKQRIAEAFHLGELSADFLLLPDYNIAPTTMQPVIRLNRETHEREMVLMRWGLIPCFAKTADEFKGFSTINAKAETLASKAIWRAPCRSRRCLVPADGFYEWKQLDARHKQPFSISTSDGEPIAFAGLWDAWKDPANGQWLQTFAIITTEANELTAAIHDRMPVILHPKDYNRWLDRGVVEQPPVDLLRPFDADKMQTSPCNPAVGNVKSNGPDMLNSK